MSTVANERRTPARPILRYHGGKFLLAPWILEHLPTHRIYTEAFMGAASVFFRKPRSYGEVLNDLDVELLNVFRVLQRPGGRQELEQLLRATPFAREEFTLSYVPSDDPVEQARRTVIRSFMGFGSAAVNAAHKTGFRCNATRSGTTPAHDWAIYPDCLKFFEWRLRGAVLENRPAETVLQQHDSEETLHYVDPPYPWSTRTYKARTSGQVYRFELADADHRSLAAVLHSLRGMVALSGYPCALYDEELFPDWHRVTRQAFADGAEARTEVLWLNPAAWAALHSGRQQQSLDWEAA
jgi:DNA adenine methylase